MGCRFVIALGPLLFGAGPAFAEDVPGFGRSVAEAKVAARQAALERLQTRLADHEPPLDAWRPTLADIDGMLDGAGEAGPSNSIDGVVHSWILKVRFPSDAELELRDRRMRRQTRAALAALAGIAAFAGWWGASSWHGRTISSIAASGGRQPTEERKSATT